MKWMIAGAIAMAGAIAIAGGAFWWTQLGADPVETRADVAILIAGPLPDSGAGSLQGYGPATVKLVGDGHCLGVDLAGEDYLVAWPDGTDVDGSGVDVTVTTPAESQTGEDGASEVVVKEATFAVGDKISGGSADDMLPARELDRYSGYIPAGCADLRVWPVLEAY
jgi:hypothetical protein